MTTRRGIALFAALSTMAVVALLVGGMVATSTIAQRSSALTHVDAELSAAADFALASAIDSSLASLPLGIARTIDASSGRITSTVSATRLPRNVLWLVAESRAAGGIAARRRVNRIERWPAPGLPEAPIVARGNVKLGPLVRFDADTAIEADCQAPTNAARVLFSSAASLVSSDSVSMRADSIASDSATFLLHATQRAFLDSFSRVQQVRGDTTIAAGRIEGVLLIDGRLILTGSVTIRGLVIARGPIDATSARVDVAGALLSFAEPNVGHFAIQLGEAVIRHSPCLIAREWRRILPLRPVKGRSWAEIF